MAAEEAPKKVGAYDDRELSGFGGTVSLLCIAGILLYCPSYFGLQGVAAILFYIVAAITSMFSVAIGFAEASTALRTRAIGDLGNALVFLIPAGVLWFVTIHRPFPSGWNSVAKIAAAVLASLGAIFVGWVATELPKAFARQPDQTQPVEDPYDRRVRQVKSAESLVVALLGLATAIISLLQVLVGVFGHTA